MGPPLCPRRPLRPSHPTPHLHGCWGLLLRPRLPPPPRQRRLISTIFIQRLLPRLPLCPSPKCSTVFLDFSRSLRGCPRLCPLRLYQLSHPNSMRHSSPPLPLPQPQPLLLLCLRLHLWGLISIRLDYPPARPPPHPPLCPLLLPLPAPPPPLLPLPPLPSLRKGKRIVRRGKTRAPPSLPLLWRHPLLPTGCARVAHLPTLFPASPVKCVVGTRSQRLHPLLHPPQGLQLLLPVR